MNMVEENIRYIVEGYSTNNNLKI